MTHILGLSFLFSIQETWNTTSKSSKVKKGQLRNNCKRDKWGHENVSLKPINLYKLCPELKNICHIGIGPTLMTTFLTYCVSPKHYKKQWVILYTYKCICYPFKGDSSNSESQSQVLGIKVLIFELNQRGKTQFSPQEQNDRFTVFLSVCLVVT